jgi:predicted nucleotidyltransferase
MALMLRYSMRSQNTSKKITLANRISPLQIARLAKPIFHRHGILKAVLFGSFARGRQSKKSDIDLILIQETSKPYFERFEGLLQELDGVIPGRDLEVFVYTPEELGRISHRKFIQQALQEGKVIYESG